MQKRMSELLQAFEHLKFEQCLRMTDQILKKLQKPDPKKKSTFTDLDMQNLYLTRIGSLAALGQLHQANQLINQKFQKPIISQSSSFLFLQICTMAIDRRLVHFTTKIHQSKQPKQQIDINRFILITHKFSELSRIFLARYVSSKDKQKNRNDSFAQIYLEYLQQLQNNNMISYSRDQVIVENKAVNFKLVWMFLMKFVELFNTFNPNKISTEQQNKYLKTKKAISDIKLKIFIHEGKAQQVRKSLVQLQKDIKQRIFIYLRSLKLLTQQPQQNRLFWRQEYLKIFRSNLNLDNYQPIYDYSVEFINEYLKDSQYKIEEFGELKRISEEELYSFKGDDKEQVDNFVYSLFSQYQLLKEREKENKKKDFYKIAMKNCLLLLIFILAKGNKIQYLQEFLLKYKEDYGKKLTFPDEIAPYFNNPQIFTPEFIQKLKANPEKIQNSQDKLIWLINCERLFARNPLQHTLQQNYIQWQRIHSLYLTNLIQVQKQKKLQKGERYLSDELLIIQADSIRKYTEQASEKDLSQIQRQQLYFYILQKLESSIVKSSSNHDTKLRAVYFCNKLNYHEEVMKILQSLDIKAVQYETLGYLYLKNFINFCSWDSNQQILVKMVKSYQEVYKESLEYSYKALSSESFNECQQNLCYYHHVERSYNFVIVLFVLYMKNKGKDNCEFYLKEILQRIREFTNNKNKKKLTLNADFKVFKNYTEFNNNSFGDFYGIYNNSTILENEVKIKLLITSLIKNEPEQKLIQLKKSIVFTQNIQQVYNFSSYDLFERQIHYKFSGEKVHQERQNSLQLKLTNKINGILLRICDFIFEIRKGQGNLYQELGEKIKQSVKELNGQLNGLTWRQQILYLPKIRYHISEIIPLLSTQIQAFSAKKKKAEGQGQKKLLCQELIPILIESITENIKLNERLPIDKKYVIQVYLHRDELLERITKMTSNQYKKLYKLKL